jgi:hypothetical protein
MKSIDTRRFLPALVIGIFMLVTVGHVASYAGGFEPPGWAWLGWPYAIAVDLSIVVAAFFTQWKSTRLAWWLYAAFVVASGFLNVGAVKPWQRSGFDVASAWVYALFPTLALAGLGFLERDAAKLSRRRDGGLLALIAGTEQEAQPSAADSQVAHAERTGNGGATDTKAEEVEGNATELPDYARETVAHFRRNPGATYQEAADALGKSRRTVGNHMRKAEEAGVASRNGSGNWTFTHS